MLSFFSTLKHFFLTTCISPRQKDKDTSRREFILNVLLVGLSCLSLPGFLYNIFFLIVVERGHYTGLSPFISIGFFGFFFGLLWLSRKGFVQLSAMTFLGALLAVCFYTSYLWGVDVPQVLLMYALVIVMAGILVSTQFSFLMTFLISIALLGLSYFQIHQLYNFNLAWRQNQSYNFGDTTVWLITMFIIAVVSWLSNREMEKTLQRARNSERELKRERDSLEEKVVQRTEELRQAQLEKLTQLYRFVEFGRLASGLFHDLTTPLNLVSLNLESLLQESKTYQKKEIATIQKYLHRATYGTKKLEDFIAAARKQLQNQDEGQYVFLIKEIEQTMQLLSYKAKQHHVQLELVGPQDLQVFVDPTMLSQIMTNLMSNAIDSFEHSSHKDKRKVLIEVSLVKNDVQLLVIDNGVGIKPSLNTKVFEPFFSTKKNKHNLGLGLSITKELITKHLHGSITVESKLHQGTTFRIIFPANF